MKVYEMVALIGSSKFKEEHRQEHARLVNEEKCVVIPYGVFPNSGDESIDMTILDDMTKQAVERCDRVHVVNVGGYIGQGTKDIIDWAGALCKKVTYMVEPDGAKDA